MVVTAMPPLGGGGGGSSEYGLRLLGRRQRKNQRLATIVMTTTGTMTPMAMPTPRGMPPPTLASDEGVEVGVEAVVGNCGIKVPVLVGASSRVEKDREVVAEERAVGLEVVAGLGVVVGSVVAEVGGVDVATALAELLELTQKGAPVSAPAHVCPFAQQMEPHRKSPAAQTLEQPAPSAPGAQQRKMPLSREQVSPVSQHQSPSEHFVSLAAHVGPTESRPLKLSPTNPGGSVAGCACRKRNPVGGTEKASKIGEFCCDVSASLGGVDAALGNRMVFLVVGECRGATKKMSDVTGLHRRDGAGVNKINRD
jgi:hypothetical protein